MARATTYPGAIQRPKRFGGVRQPKIDKVLWHTTESDGWPSYPDFSPTLTVDPIKQQIQQHMEIDWSASTLRNSGSFKTNRANVAQIEIVGYCADDKIDSRYHTSKWGDAERMFLAGVAAWFKIEWGVPLTSTVTWVSYDDAYYARRNQRLSIGSYSSYTGHLGHQHAPGNTHPDPGQIGMINVLNLASLLIKEPAVTHPVSVAPFTPNPAPGESISRRFRFPDRQYRLGWHTGRDYASELGDRVNAVVNGVWRRQAFDRNGYGNWGILQGENGRDYVYCHLSEHLIGSGDRVVAGNPVGLAGATGNAQGPHLHLEDRPRGGGYGNVREPSWPTWDGKSYPGRAFVVGQSHPAVTLLGYRLQAWLGDSIYAVGPGPKFTATDEALVKKFQAMIGNKPDGWPGATEWRKLLTEPKVA